MKDKIVLNNLGLIHKAIKDLHCVYRNKEEYDTFYYAGLIGLIRASKTYDKSKGESTYLYNNISSRIRNVFKYRSSHKRYNGLTEISLNNEINNIEYQDMIPSNYNMEKEIINKMYVEYLLSKLKDKKYKKYIIEYYGIGCSALNTYELAEKYGVSYQSVQQMIQWGLKLLRKEIE